MLSRRSQAFNAVAPWFSFADDTSCMLDMGLAYRRSHSPPSYNEGIHAAEP
jgi:hypothetical protein